MEGRGSVTHPPFVLFEGRHFVWMGVIWKSTRAPAVSEAILQYSFYFVSFQPGILDYLKHLLGKIFQKEDWVLWNVDVEKIIVHPQYNKSKTNILRLKE
jgi:hypothetical protein